MDRQDMRMEQVVAADAAVGPANPPPPPPPPENNGMQLAIYNPAELPLKKRILVLLRAEAENPENQFACNDCGRAFVSRRALAGHRAHHRVGPAVKKRRAVVVQGGSEPRPCARCGRVFGSARGLGAHKRFCKGGARLFDLNELPPAAEEEVLPLLPWLR